MFWAHTYGNLWRMVNAKFCKMFQKVPKFVTLKTRNHDMIICLVILLLSIIIRIKSVVQLQKFQKEYL